MKRPSGSSLARAIQCPASHVLPQVKTSSEASLRGTAIHEFVARLGKMSREEALAMVPDEFRPACEALNLDLLPPLKDVKPEVRLVLDVKDGSAFIADEGDIADLRPFEVLAIADGVAVLENEVVVLEWKTGQAVTPARNNWQLKLSVAAAALVEGRSSGVGAIVYLREDRQPVFDVARFDAFDIDDIVEDVAKAIDGVEAARRLVSEGMTPTVSMGSECRYCPAMASCPGQLALIRSVASSPADAVERRWELTPATAAKAYQQYRNLQEATKRIGEALRNYAMAHPIDLGDGIVYGPRESSRESVVGPVVRRVMVDKYGLEAADAACSFESSKTAIKQALRPVAAQSGVPLAKLERETLEAVRLAGGVEVKDTTVVDEHKETKR